MGIWQGFDFFEKFSVKCSPYWGAILLSNVLVLVGKMIKSTYLRNRNIFTMCVLPIQLGASTLAPVLTIFLDVLEDLLTY
jgi:hypothetical protein